MKVVEVRKLEDCFDGSRIFEFRLDQASDQASIDHIGRLGRLEYFRDFARPFFRVTSEKEFMIKGVEGKESFQAIILNRTEENLTRIETWVDQPPVEGVQYGEET